MQENVVDNYLVLDLETNGCPGSSSSDRKHHRIVQIAVVYNKALFSKLVKPGVWIPASSTAIHRITNEDVRDAPELAQVMCGLRNWLEAQGLDFHSSLRVVAHNAFGFDLPLLRQRCIAVGCPLPKEWIWLDTLPIARRLWKALPPDAQIADHQRWKAMKHDPPLPSSDNISYSASLGKVHARYLGTLLQGAHDASVDVAGLRAVLPFLLPHAKDSDYSTTDQERFNPLPDTEPITSLVGIGAPTAAKLSKILDATIDTIGDLRKVLSQHGCSSHEEQETILRKVIKPSDWVLSTLQQINKVPEAALIDDFPFVETDEILSELPLDSITRRRLLSEGIRTSDDLVQCFLYELQGNMDELRLKLNLNLLKWNACRQRLKSEWAWKCPALNNGSCSIKSCN